MRSQRDPVSKIGLVAFIVGGLAVLIGESFSLRPAVAAGALLLAVAPAAIGLQTMVSGRIRLPIDRFSEFEESYSGFGARAWGLLFLLASGALAVYGLLKLAGVEGEVLDLLDHRRGLAAAGMGFALALFGMAQASKVTLLHSGQVRRVCMLPERIGGAITALIGLTLLAGGLVHMASPVLFGKLVSGLGRGLLRILR